MATTIIETHAFTLDQLLAYRSGDVALDTLPIATIEVPAEVAAFLELVDEESELTEDGEGDELLEEDD